jgi:hypothetical protein
MGMDWWQALDHYCERVGPGFWGEPFNAISNAAFLVAAALILFRQAETGWPDKPVALLAVLTAFVGIGSVLFHTFANGWSLVADVLPIAIVIYGFFYVALRRLLRLGAPVAAIAMVALFLMSPAIEGLLAPLLGGSAAYAPGLIATFGVAFAVPAVARGPVPRLLVAAGIAFGLALVFRVLDEPSCASWPIGTHFVWHVLNGVALALALFAVEGTAAAHSSVNQTQ